jgi:hypothetical protein
LNLVVEGMDASQASYLNTSTLCLNGSASPAHIYAWLRITELIPILCPLEHAAKKTSTPVAKVLVPLALNDASIFHAILSFSSSLIDARSGRITESDTTLVHRVNAIRPMNQSLQDIQQATNDTVVASIYFL